MASFSAAYERRGYRCTLDAALDRGGKTSVRNLSSCFRCLPGPIHCLGAANRVGMRPYLDLRPAIGCRERNPLDRRAGETADGRIIIMPGCGVRENNIGKIEAETGAKEFHTSARSIVYSKMEYRNENVPMGSSIVSSEFETVQTDREKVKAYI